MGTFDHIIVGSGINSLVCAATLADQGRRVLVLERNERIGGCIRTDEATVPGFRHDVMATTFLLFVTAPYFPALYEGLRRHGLEFCNSDLPTGVLRSDGSHLIHTRRRSENIAALNAIEPGDGDRYGRDLAEVDANAPLLFGLLGDRVRSARTAGLLARNVWRRGLGEMTSFAGRALTPTRGWLETGYRSDLSRALLAPWGLHAGLNPEDAFSSQIVKVTAFSLEAAGAPIVKGGADKLLDAFEALIREKGGTIRTSSDVASVIVEARRAKGVRLATGEEIRAERGVICSVAPGQLYGRLLERSTIPKEAEAAEGYRYGKGNFQIHYALDRPPAWRDETLGRVALLHLTDGLDAVSKASNEAVRGHLPHKPTICVGQPHALDPTRCPPGKAILWLQLPEAPRIVRGDAAGLLDVPPDGRWSEALREAYADRVEDILCSHIPDLRETVLGRRAYSPADLEAMNCNLVGGEPYGGACTIDQSLLWRPLHGTRDHATPIRGLHHIGASTHPGPGLSGASGYLAARALA